MTATRRRAVPVGRVRQRLRRDPAAVAGGIIVGSFVIVALLAPVLAPHGAATSDLSELRPGHIPGPSPEHPLGLDQQGRDVLSRLIYGARSSLFIGVGAVAVGLLVGVVLGGMAGGLGGAVDVVVMRVMDVLLAIPGLFLAIGVTALLGPSLLSMAVGIGVAGVPLAARLLRGPMVSAREQEYVLAARAVGASNWRVVTYHVLPSCVSPLLATATLAVGGAILGAAALAFLGLGPNDPALPEWGRMLAEGERALRTSPQLVLCPGACIAIVVLGFNLLGDALQTALDPRRTP